VQQSIVGKEMFITGKWDEKNGMMVVEKWSDDSE
jgi:hypothetical protein